MADPLVNINNFTKNFYNEQKDIFIRSGKSWLT